MTCALDVANSSSAFDHPDLDPLDLQVVSALRRYSISIRDTHLREP